MSDRQRQLVLGEDLDQLPLLVLLDAPVACQRCGQPCWTRTARQKVKGTHPLCLRGAWWDRLDPAVELLTIQYAEAVLGAVWSRREDPK